MKNVNTFFFATFEKFLIILLFHFLLSFPCQQNCLEHQVPHIWVKMLRKLKNHRYWIKHHSFHHNHLMNDLYIYLNYHHRYWWFLFVTSGDQKFVFVFFTICVQLFDLFFLLILKLHSFSEFSYKSKWRFDRNFSLNFQWQQEKMI